jgi:Ca2+-binding RTX toxin-like protein
MDITGTPGNDTLTGTSGNDTINGLGGNDLIQGLEGNDTLIGGDGNDTLEGGNGRDSLYGGNGDDVLKPGLTTQATEEIADGGIGTDLLVVDYSNLSYGNNGIYNDANRIRSRANNASFLYFTNIDKFNITGTALWR